MWMPGLEAEVLCIRHADDWVRSRGFVHQTCGCLGWKQRFCASDMWMPGLEAEVLCIRHVDARVGSRGFVYQTCG